MHPMILTHRKKDISFCLCLCYAPRPLRHMEKTRSVEKDPKTKKDDLIVIGGGGGFIGGALASYFSKKGFTRIRAVDKKPLPEWYQRVSGTECLTMDLSEEKNCR